MADEVKHTRRRKFQNALGKLASLRYRAPEAPVQELWCHACDKNVTFKIDLNLDGNHVLNCPNCGHEHCRVVKNGMITGDRWDQRNGDTFVTYTTMTSSSFTASGSSTYFTYSAWQDSSTSS